MQVEMLKKKKEKKEKGTSIEHILGTFYGNTDVGAAMFVSREKYFRKNDWIAIE